MRGIPEFQDVSIAVRDICSWIAVNPVGALKAGPDDHVRWSWECLSSHKRELEDGIRQHGVNIIVSNCSRFANPHQPILKQPLERRVPAVGIFRSCFQQRCPEELL